MDPSRSVLIRYTRDGTQRRGSGLRVGGRFVLTADHCANGTGHMLIVGGQEYPATVHMRSNSEAVDVAVLIAPKLPEQTPLECALVNRDVAKKLINCQALGYPWWKKIPQTGTVPARPVLAQTTGEVLTAEGIDPYGTTVALLTFSITDQRAQGRTVPNGGLDQSRSQWAGMSGAGVVTADDVLVGVIRSHTLAEGGHSLTITPLEAITTLPEPTAQVIWSALQVTDPTALPRLPIPGGNTVGQAELESADRTPSESGVELSPDVVEKHSAAFVSAGVAPPARWSSGELSRIVLDQNPSRLFDLVQALRRAVEAKPVLVDLSIGKLELGQLQVIYRQEVGSWPTGASVDALLVEAAEADRSEQRRGAASGFGALARFVVGAAAALSAPPQGSPALASWIESLGHQLADAQRHYIDRRNAPSWLLIDLGMEPRLSTIDGPLSATPPWPTRITWTYTSRQQSLTSEVTAIATKVGLAEALKEIFAAVPPSWPLLVDLAMPAGLLGEGIEHWPLFFDHSESLSDRYSPRLRWSQRRHDLVLHGRSVDRAARSSWNAIPRPLMDSVLGDETRLKRWIQAESGHAWMIGRQPASYRADPLRVLLKAGFSFVIWYRQGANTRRGFITQAVSTIPVDARRLVIPDELVDLPELPVVIWDDPRGRGEFELPPLVAAEHIPLQHV